MKAIIKKVLFSLSVALLISGATTLVLAQTKKNKKKNPSKAVITNTPTPDPTPAPTPQIETEPKPAKKNSRDNESQAKNTSPVKTDDVKENGNAIVYSYEFTQPNFVTSRIFIEHDADGKGKITFERKSAGDPITDPVEVSATAWARIKALWEELDFLNSTVNYQSEKQFPHLGTMRLKMKNGEKERTAEFNWTNDKKAFELANEYRRIADQAMFVFDINLARDTSPLDTPKMMDGFESMLKRNSYSDPKQMLPLLQDISNDERIPLIARNHAKRLVSQIEKMK